MVLVYTRISCQPQVVCGPPFPIVDAFRSVQVRGDEIVEGTIPKPRGGRVEPILCQVVWSFAPRPKRAIER
jgi:hypothetical protein